ncbi:hypothetical protein C7974DRAFT_302833 [Boeremia exigua]|uniref:uncharacterized protein n=1 Tax=Boeremia exigua TaxID=749465 RepID=UPI001E8E83E3|nr:uncharacterized protein C7974DRAFT_302833 [Boeremia exigua]KAH6643144.1 hypothetical protein C7974DRAFT_302833 [Boeremia exigua]
MFRSSISIFGIRTPRPDHDAENPPVPSLSLPVQPSPAPPSRFARFSTNARTMVGSSVYSQSPGPPKWRTPKMPSMGFSRRPVSADLETVINPAFASHSAASYVGTISQDSPPPLSYRHPADVQLPADDPFVDPEAAPGAEENPGPRRHRRRRRRRQHRADHWKRKRSDRGKLMPFVRGAAARGKLIACIISGSFLVVVLSTYLAIALTNKDIGQEIHILFILLLLSITIFFCHSLIRLCMLLLNPPPPSSSSSTSAPAFQLNPAGFSPEIPIPVRLARDDDLVSDSEDEWDEKHEKEALPPPPPAYGLWRSSVRADPNLLHWARVEGARAESAVSMPRSRNGSVVASSVGAPNAPGATGAAGAQSVVAEPVVGPRPPSYVLDDAHAAGGFAAPAPSAGSPGVAGQPVHPAWRASYVMSEIRPGEVPAGVGRRLT